MGLHCSNVSLEAGACSREKKAQSGQIQLRVKDYATMEGITNGVPVWSFSNLCYIWYRRIHGPLFQRPGELF